MSLTIENVLLNMSTNLTLSQINEAQYDRKLDVSLNPKGDNHYIFTEKAMHFMLFWSLKMYFNVRASQKPSLTDLLNSLQYAKLLVINLISYGRVFQLYFNNWSLSLKWRKNAKCQWFDALFIYTFLWVKIDWFAYIYDYRVHKHMFY